MTNKTNAVLYTGVTSDLTRRVSEYQDKIVQGFTSTYHAGKLVYYELFTDPQSAISREKQIKAGSRQRKVELIARLNSNWRDLSEDT